MKTAFAPKFLQFLLLPFFVFVLNVGWGQFSITGAGSGNTYTQNFNSFAGTSATLPSSWAIAGTVTTYNTTSPIITAGTTTFSSAASNAWSACRPNSTSSDYAIAMKHSTSGSSTLTFSVTNNTGSAITGFVLGWNSEQYTTSTRASTLNFNYRLGTGLYETTGLSGTTLTTATTGNDAVVAANAVITNARSITISGISLASSETADFRFTIAPGGTSGSACLIGIDDFTIYATAAAATPTITASGTLSAVNTTYGTASSSTSFNVSGANMSAGILVTPPAGYEVSLASGSGYASTVTVGSSGTIASTPVYVRLAAATAVGSYSGNIVLSSTSATSVNVATVSSFVSAKALTVQASNQTKTQGNSSPSTGTLNTHYTVSELANSDAVNQVTLSYSGSPSGGETAATAGSYTITPSALTFSTGSANNYSITYNTGVLTINSAEAATIDPVTLTSALSTTYGTASTGGSFTSSGSNLTGNITATAQSGYEVSTSSGSGYGASVSVASGTTVYVRFASTRAAGIYNSATAVVLSSTGATDVNVTTSATGNSVSQKALSIDGLTAQNKVYDGLTTATVTGTAALVTSGIVNSDVVSLSGSGTFTFSSSSVGTSIAITTMGYSLTGTNAGNYTLTQPSFSGDITLRSLTITASNVSKYAGVALTGGSGSTAFTSSGLQNSESIGTVTIAYGSAGAATGDGNTVGVYASQVTPSAATGGTYAATNYSISYVAGSITVTSAPVTLASWNFFGESNTTNPTTSTADVSNSNLSSAPVLSRGSTAVSSAGANSFRTTGFQNNGIATSNTDYFQTSITSTNSIISLSTIDATFIGTSSFFASPGVTSQFAYSLDGTNFTLIGSSQQSTSLTLTQIDLSGVSALQNVSANTTITLRYYASGQTTTGGWGFSSASSSDDGFTIKGSVKTAPQLSTPTSASIATTSATLGATISSDGGASVTARGTVWGTAAAPTGNSLAASGTTVDAFSHERTGLTANTLYYYRGYATNSVGTGYSADGTFTTLPLAPTVGSGSSASVSGFTASWTAATMGSAAFTYTVEVDDDNAFGSATASSIASSNTSTALTGLTAGTIYYYRVKSVNATGSSSWSSTSAGYATLSTDATLSALSLSAGTLNSVFASATIAYTASVTNATTSITVTPTLNQANANIQVRVNGGSYTAVTSGNASGSLALNVNVNTVDVLVTAQDGSTVKTYTITVTRAATTPSAPTITSITPGNQQLSVVFTAGVTGGSAITNYKYSTDGGTTFTTVSPAQTTSPIVITGLTNGTAYNVQILAVNAVGDGTPSGSTSSTPVTTPGAPTITSITPGNGQLSVAFTEGSTGGSALTNYKYSTDGGATFSAVAPAATISPITITGLVNGTSYNVQIKAVNAVGDGTATGSTAAIPVTTPGAPSIGTAVLGDGQATVTFTAPASSGGTAITSYTVTSSPEGITTTGSGSPITITGLTNGNAYTFTVSATNVVGTGPESAASNEVTPSTIAVPVINSSLSASATYGVVATTFTITATNSPTSFSATDLPSGLILNTSTGNITGTPIAAPGDYNVTITATNAGGTGLPATLVYSIAAKPLTLSDAAASSKVYNGTNAAVLTGTLTGVVGIDDVSLVGTGTFAQSGIGTGLSVTSTATLTGANASYYTLTQPTGLTANITAKPLTVTGAIAVNRAYTGLASATIAGTTLVGVVAPDEFTVTGSGSFTDVNVANGISVTAALILGGANAGNYTLTQPTGLTANITLASLTITGLTGTNKVYDGLTTATATGTSAYVGLVNGETFTVSGTPVLNFTNASVGNLKTITVTGYTAPSGNYSITQPTLTANITAAVLTITGLTGGNKIYDGTNAASATGTASYVGLQNGETAAVSGTPIFNFSDANVGTGKTITVAGYTAPSNYTVIQPTGLTGNITIANQTITALTTPITKILSDVSYSVATTATSGLTVTYASNNSSVATVAANGTVTIQGIGTSTITASQVGNGNYNPATSVTQALTVNPNPAITATPSALAAFSSATGSASAAQAFTVSGSNLIADITVTAPLGFEVSLTSGSGYTTSSLTINQSSGTANATVYVRLTSIANAGIYSGDVAITSTSATTSNVSVSGTVSLAVTSGLIAGWDFQTTSNGGTAAAAAPNTPTNFTANFGSGNIYLNGTNGSSTWVTATSGNQLTSFGGTTNVNVGSGFSTSNSGASSLSLIPGTSLAANGKSLVFKFSMTGYKDLIVSYAVNVSSTTSFSTHQWDYSTNGTSWTTGQTITTFTTAYGTKTLTTITNLDNAATGYLRLTVSGATSVSSNTRIDNVQLNAAANPSPAIIAGGGPLSSLNTTYGTASSPTSFTVSGSNLGTTISIAALSGFEFNNPSLNSTYTSTLSDISATGPTTINVRLTNSAVVGSYSGNIACSSGSTTLNVPMSTSTVSKATPTVSISNSPQTYSSSPISATVTGSVAGTVSNVKYNGSASVPTAPGTYAVTANFVPTDGNNYNSITNSSAGDFVISKATLTITATNQSKCEGTTLALGTSLFTTSGLLGSDAVSSVTLTSSGASSGAAAGSYSIVPSAASGSGLSNYNITYTNGSLTVNALPIAPTAGSTSRCGEGAVTLTASANTGATTDWYAASSGGSALAQTTGTFTTPTLTSTTTYYVEARNTTTGCLSASRISVIATIITPEIPSVAIVSSDANNAICPNETVTFTATATNGGTAPTYQWKLNGSNVDGTGSTYVTSALSNNDIVSVVMTANNSCQSPNSATSNAITTVVNTTPAALSITGSTYCSHTNALPNTTYGSVTSASSTTGIYYTLFNVSGDEVLTIPGTNNALVWTGVVASPGYTVIGVNASTGCVGETSTTTEVIQTTATIPLYTDTDGDNFGTGAASGWACSASAPAGYSLNTGDCDNSNSAIKPTAVEICGNNIDENCSGASDDAPIAYRSIADGNWGDASTWEMTCNAGSAYVSATYAPVSYFTGITSIQNAHDIIIPADGVTYQTGTLEILSGGSLTLTGNGFINIPTSGTVSPIAKLTVTQSINNAGTLTIGHQASLAQISTTAANTGSGIVNVETKLTGSNNGTAPNGRYWYIGSPMNNTVGSQFFDAQNMVRLWSYNGSNNSWSVVVHSTSNPTVTTTKKLVPGIGYLYRAGSEKIITYEGTLSTLNNNIVSNLLTPVSDVNYVSVSGYQSTGYKFVANPYPSYIDWKLVTRSGLNVSYWIRNANNSAYDAYNATTNVSSGSSGQTTQFIPPMQGFYVYAFNSTPSLRIDNTDRVHSSNVLHAPTVNQVVRLKLNNGESSDYTVVYENELAANDYEEADTDKMFDYDFHQLYTLEGEHELALNGLLNATTKESVDMGIAVPNNGSYTIEATDLEVEEEVILEDKFTNIFQDMKVNPIYSFTTNAGTFNERFVLHFTETETVGLEETETVGETEGVNVYTTTGQQVKVWVTNTADFQNATVKVYDAVGNMIERKNMTSNELYLDLDIANGIYVVEVTGDSKVFTKKIFISK